MGKDLSARLVSTLKLFAERMASAMYSTALAAMACAVLSQPAARTTDAAPKTFCMASRAHSCAFPWF